MKAALLLLSILVLAPVPDGLVWDGDNWAPQPIPAPDGATEGKTRK